MTPRRRGVRAVYGMGNARGNEFADPFRPAVARGPSCGAAAAAPEPCRTRV